MNILLISPEYPPIGGGGSVVCQGVAEAFVQSGHHVDVVTSGMKGQPRSEEVKGVRLFRVPCVRRHRHYTTTWQLATTLLPSYRQAKTLTRRRTYDLTHCHFVVPSGPVACLLHKTVGLPYVLTAHGSDVPGYNPDRFAHIHRLLRPLWSTIVRNSIAVTASSRFLASLIGRVSDVPVELIPNGLDSPRTPAPGRRNRLLVASRLFERKGVQHLIRALEGLETGWEVCVAGDGPYLPELKRLAREKGVAVNFLGFLPRNELRELYRSSQVFVFPSSAENFPIVLLEAMAAGCAVVTSTAAGCAEVVGDAGLRVPAGDTAGLRQVLTALLADEAEIRRLGELARARSELYSWRHIAARYEALFHRCLNGSVSVELS